MNINFIIHEPSDVYHEQSRTGKYLSSHRLGDFRKSPKLYYKKMQGLIKESETSALFIGRAAHCLILEGRASFEEQYVVSDGPINPNTGEVYTKNTKAYAAWKASQTKEIVSGTDFNLLAKLQQGVLEHSNANELLLNGVAEGVVRAEYCNMPCQIRMDWFNPDYGLVDLKTCENADRFKDDIYWNGYIHQMAFYRAVIRVATGITVPVTLIGVEKKEPCSARVIELSAEDLDVAEKINSEAIKRLRECYATGVWPTGYEGIERPIYFNKNK